MDVKEPVNAHAKYQILKICLQRRKELPGSPAGVKVSHLLLQKIASLLVSTVTWLVRTARSG